MNIGNINNNLNERLYWFLKRKTYGLCDVETLGLRQYEPRPVIFRKWLKGRKTNDKW